MNWYVMLERVDWQSWIAALALLFSGYTFWKQYRLEKEQADQQRQLSDLMIAKELAEAKSAKRADISANLIKELKGSKVKVFNRGQARATNVRLVIDESSSALKLLDREIFPLEALEPQQGVSLIAAVYMSSPSKMPITLIWDDETGNNNEKTVYLTR